MVKVKVMGNLPKNNSWTNIALRWEPLKFNDSATYQEAKLNYKTSELGGLQLLLPLAVEDLAQRVEHDQTLVLAADPGELAH